MSKIFQLEVVQNEQRWVETTRPYATKQFTDIAGNMYYAAIKIYRIAFIGRGSAVAYYLTALAPRKGYAEPVVEQIKELHAKMAIFGKVDPWTRDVRGDGYINHERHLIEHWGSKVGEYSTDYMRRAAFAEQNAQAFKDAEGLGAEIVNQDVWSVDRRGDVYQIFTQDCVSYYAAFVVSAMGLGPHRGLQSGKGAPKIPEETRGIDRSLMMYKLAPSVMDLDRFMREYPERGGIEDNLTKRLDPDPQKLTILVHGANAGIDAVQRAWQLGHLVKWLCPDAPQFLLGNRLPIAKDNVSDVERYQLQRDTEVVVSPGKAGKVNVTWTHERGTCVEDVDIYVISVGQDPYAKGAVGDVLFRRGNLKEAELSMIWDFDQVFGLPFQTILGYQAPGTHRGFGLQIIGASCEVLTRELGKVFTSEQLIADFTAQLTPLDNEPTEEHCNRQISNSQALSEKWDSVQGRKEYYAQKHANWERAQQQRSRFVELANAYLKETRGKRGPLMELLSHQFDPAKVPESLSTILESFKDDVFLIGQLATSEWPATTSGASGVLPSQLSAVRAVVAALNAFIPEYIIDGDSNFSTDDRNMLAVYIAENFPGFSSLEANARVAATMSLRRSKHYPLGFHDDDLRRAIQERWGEESER